MARKSISERLAQLEAQKKTLKARLGRQDRANDTRRKVLLGALVLHRLEAGRDAQSDYLNAWLKRELPGFLTRDHDKALFDDLLLDGGKASAASGTGGNSAAANSDQPDLASKAV